jgi:hypothetical protein
MPYAKHANNNLGKVKESGTLKILIGIGKLHIKATHQKTISFEMDTESVNGFLRVNPLGLDASLFRSKYPLRLKWPAMNR